MESVRVFSHSRGHVDWNNLAKLLEDRGVEIFTIESAEKRGVPDDVELSIALSGKFVNPLALKGKKVLAYNSFEWLRNVPIPTGFSIYKFVLDEYYDDYIDLTNMSIEDCADKIMDYIGGEDV